MLTSEYMQRHFAKSRQQNNMGLVPMPIIRREPPSDSTVPIIASPGTTIEQQADSGITNETAAAGIAVAGGALLLLAGLTVLSGFIGYKVGEAVAPSKSKEKKYAWIGAGTAVIGVPIVRSIVT